MWFSIKLLGPPETLRGKWVFFLDVCARVSLLLGSEINCFCARKSLSSQSNLMTSDQSIKLSGEEPTKKQLVSHLF
jgi:hypothetical protein